MLAITEKVVFFFFFSVLGQSEAVVRYTVRYITEDAKRWLSGYNV